MKKFGIILLLILTMSFMVCGCSQNSEVPSNKITEESDTDQGNSDKNDDLNNTSPTYNNEQGFSFFPLPEGDYAVSIGNARYLNTIEFPSIFQNKSVTKIVSDQITYNKYNNNAYSSIKKVVIPSSITEIDDYSFASCTNLKDILLPSSIIKIGNYAFAGCSSLYLITIPNSVTHIGLRTFYDCENLKHITLSDNLEYIGNECFLNCNNLATTYTNDAYYIGSQNYHNFLLYKITNNDLTNHTINDECKIIYSATYRGCSKLTKITIPKNITHIMDFAFAECSSLKDITFENNSSLKNIDIYCFYGCLALEKIKLPNTITNIGRCAFGDCAKLSIFFAGTQPEWKQITIGIDSDSKYNLYFYSETEESNCWHYDTDGITPILW